MKIKGIENMTKAQIIDEINNGGKFVTFLFCYSLVFMTYKRSSNVYFIKNGEHAFFKGLKYTLFVLILGWWGFPWGPIYTIQSLFTNCFGGKNVTDEIVECLDEMDDEGIA